MKLNKILLLIPLIVLVAGCGGGSGAPSASLVSIAVTPATASIANGTNQQFIATGTFSDTSTHDLTQSVTWYSSATSATISNTAGSNGRATAAAVGTTTITASSGTITSNPAILTVTAATLVSLVITPANPILAFGAVKQLTATGTFSDNTTQNMTTSVIWGSSVPSVATISNTGSNGLAASVGAGITTITAVFGVISGSTTLTVTVPAGGSGAANVLSVTVNGSLCSSGSYPNKPCVRVTVCTPGTTTCQSISDILLDTGSYGLRVFKQALTVPLNQVASGSGALAECIQFVDGTAEWGPVQTANVVLGGESAVTVPIQVLDAAFGTVPASCGTPEGSPAAAGYNGILGVGLFPEDCGAGCVSGAGNEMYFSCSGASCSGTAVALASQVQNPVAHLPVDNNGVLVQLPVVLPGGAPSDNGQLVLGIGTQTNNVPSGVTAFPANLNGDFTTVFNDTTISNSFLDTGSNGLFFNDSAIPACAAPNAGWYCPPATLSLSATTLGTAGSPSGTVSFQIGNATSLFNSGNQVFVELGGSIPGVSGFDWGIPFFYGHNVFVGIQGKSSNLGTGPYWAY
jgi:hypothetical protein